MKALVHVWKMGRTVVFMKAIRKMDRGRSSSTIEWLDRWLVM